MFTNVIVGVDGDEGGRDAIALATLLRGRAGALTFAHVHCRSGHLWGRRSRSSEVADADRARTLLEKERDRTGAQARLRLTSSPSVGRGLHGLSEELGADLLVVGSSRRGPLGRVLVGDDTRAALNRAPCAVAIAPSGFGSQPTVMREIGVGYNGSPESAHALGFARSLAAEHHCKLSAYEAVCIPARIFAAPVWSDPAAIEETVGAAYERIDGFEGVEPYAAFGIPAEELSLYSASLDLLVVGSRGYGPIGRLVHGSTAHQLARSARCPLLVLTRAARTATAAPVAPMNDSETGTVTATHELEAPRISRRGHRVRTSRL